ncbi:MAG: peptidoglycan-binding protein [Actinomycetia bacterium]|nr:peptidoglycan-binding protein [Actinomycetes bacterium]
MSEDRPTRRRFMLGAGTLVVAAGTGVAAWATDTWPALSTTTAPQTDTGGGTVNGLERVAVTRGTLSSEREYTATVSFGDPWTLTTSAAGTVTGANAQGTVVGFGEVLVRIDEEPLTLAEGAMPMYRELRRVDTRLRDENGDRQVLLTGLDVVQLQTFLVAAGFDADDKMDVDGEFGATTEDALEAWQKAVGLPVTGRIDDRHLVFSPTPTRIAWTTRVGAVFTALEVNDADAQVFIDTTNRGRSALVVDAGVEVELADGTTMSGTVAKQEPVSQPDGSRVWRTTVRVDDGLSGDIEDVTVTATEMVATDVLLVPVGALLALAQGGHAVELAGPTGTTLVAVEVGEVLDGRAEVEGAIAEGDELLVAT